jgi:hypothetical protein
MNMASRATAQDILSRAAELLEARGQRESVYSLIPAAHHQLVEQGAWDRSTAYDLLRSRLDGRDLMVWENEVTLPEIIAALRGEVR